MRTSQLIVRLTVLTAVLATGACSTSTSSGPASTAAGTSSNAAAPAPSATPTPTPTAEALTADNFAERVDATEKTFDTAHIKGSITSDGDKVAIEGDMSQKPDDEKAALTMKGGGLVIDMRVVDDTSYVKVGNYTQGKWVKMKNDDPDNPIDPQELFSSDTALLEGAEDAIVGFEKVGEPVTVGDGPAQQYDVTVDTKKADKTFVDSLDVPASKVPAKIEYHLWVDDQDRVVRVKDTIAGDSEDLTISKLGETVTVTAPPKSEQIAKADTALAA